MRKESQFGKVIARALDGRLFKGFSKADFIGEEFQLIDAKGNPTKIPLAELKAIFFVRDFRGDPAHNAIHFFAKEPPRPWLWVRVTFVDGEVLEGRARNNVNLMDGKGFFLWVSDDTANNEAAFVVRSALKEFTVLGTA
ncbi:MAG TPA: hypothetical protein PLM33_02375 [Acidobacteriota bacterium]|nr:hypothetical protein [Acidobacteriota bacterium]HRV09604.1 hypothetical protein [Acidobacteriota bacterium]